MTPVAPPEPSSGRGNQRSARRTGAIVGGGVGAISLVLAAACFQVSDGSAIVVPFAVPALASAVIGGWLMGRRAMGASTWRGWLGTVAGLAVVAVLIGDFLVVATLLVTSARDSGQEPVIYVISSLPAAAGIYLIGLVAIGPVALIVTLPAAAVWAWAMSRLVPRRHQVAGNATHAPSAAPSATNNG